MTKKKFTEEELRFNEDIKKIVLDILEKNKKPMIKIEVSDDKPNLFQSKFGGLPYLPKDKEAPRDKENRQFTLLAQINIKELPENNIYPMKEGILQFWILNDDVYGLDFDNPLGNGYKVVYYKEIDKSVTEEEILEKYKPYEEDENYFPIEGEFSLKFELRDGYFSDSNDDFREIVDEEMKKFYLDKKIKIANYVENILSKIGEITFEEEQDLEYYIESFYCYNMAKYYYELNKKVVSVKALTENYGITPEDELLIDKEELKNCLGDFFINIEYELELTPAPTEDMCIMGVDVVEFTMWGEIVGLLYNEKDNIIYLKEQHS